MRERDHDRAVVDVPAGGRPLLRRGLLALGRPLGGLRPRGRPSARARRRCVLDDRAVTYERAQRERPSACRRGWPTRGVAARRRRDPARPPLDRGRRRAARLPAPRRRARAAAADVQRDAAVGTLTQTPREALVAFGGEKEIAKCLEVADQVAVPAGDALAASSSTSSSAQRACRRPRARDADDVAVVLHSSGTTSAPEGHLALQQHPALRDRGAMPPLGADAATTSTSSVASSASSADWSSATCPRCSTARPASSLNRWDADEALRLIEQHRCTYVLAMPTHAADMIAAGERDRRATCSSMRVLAARA